MLDLKEKSLTVVIRGSFNPSIFHPQWFASMDIIGKKEAETAQIEVVHRDIALFQMEWLRLEVTQDRFVASTTLDNYYLPLRDLVSSTFYHLRFTPLTVMGINTQCHFMMDNEDAWHGFGNRIAPKDLWEPILSSPGTQNLTIQGERDDGFSGHIQVTVQPSNRYCPGLFFSTNDHFILVPEEGKEIEAPDTLQEVVGDENFGRAMARYTAILEHLEENT